MPELIVLWVNAADGVTELDLLGQVMLNENRQRRRKYQAV